MSDSMHSPDLSGKIALVTGASKGIGADVAIALGKAGAHVLLLGRDVQRLEATDDAIQAAGSSASIVPADLSDPQVPEALAQQIDQRWGKLDILIGNAGVLGDLSPVPHLSHKEWDSVIDSNLSSNFRLLKALDPLLQASGSARVVMVSTGAVPNPRAFWSAYAASKAGLEALTHSYAHEVHNLGVLVNILDPGAVRTDMRAAAKPGEDPMSLPPGWAIAHEFLALCAPDLDSWGQRVTVTPLDNWRELEAKQAE